VRDSDLSPCALLIGLGSPKSDDQTLAGMLDLPAIEIN
jgi:hypothetical protein